MFLLLDLTVWQQFESNVDLREQSTKITRDVKDILHEVKQPRDTRVTPPPSLIVNTNTNSGNTTTTTISDSYNNDSMSCGGE